MPSQRGSTETLCSCTTEGNSGRGSSLGEKQGQRTETWESQGHVPKTETDIHGLMCLSRMWEVQTGLRLLILWSPPLDSRKPPWINS